MNAWQFLKSSFGVRINGQWNDGNGHLTLTSGVWWWLLNFFLLVFLVPLFLVGSLWWVLTDFGPWAGLW